MNRPSAFGGQICVRQGFMKPLCDAQLHIDVGVSDIETHNDMTDVRRLSAENRSIYLFRYQGFLTPVFSVYQPKCL